MQQTTLDAFCKVKIKEKTVPQSEPIRSKYTPLKGSNKRKLTMSTNTCKKRSPLLMQNKRVLSVNRNKSVEILEERQVPKLEYGNMDLNISKTIKSQSASTNDSPTKSPKTFTPKSPTSLNQTLTPKKITHRKLFSCLIDTDLLHEAINQMNLAKQGAIPANNFNLEQIYTTNHFQFAYAKLNASTTVRYTEESVVMPLEIHSEHMFTVITTVFSNPVNCGYFPEPELDFVFSILTLSKRAQMLFIRMLKRKHTWHRVSLLNYPEVAEDLKPIFEELVTKSFCNSDTETENMLTTLGLLQVDELTKLCRELKVNCTGTKETKIENILKSYYAIKPLFPGMKSPMHALALLVKSKLGLCVRISETAIRIFDKIITLLIPNRDPEQTLSELFFMFGNVQTGQVLFPSIPIHGFPIFADTAQLEGFAEAKSVYTKILNCIKHKDWENVRMHGRACYACACNVIETESNRLENCILPTHVKRYEPLYIWLKALSKTIDAFKKTPGTMHMAVQLLHFLLSQNYFLRHYRAKWYSELALIEMHHHKDLETSAATTLTALTENNLSDVDLTDLLDRAEKLVRRKTGISSDTKKRVRETLAQATLRVPKFTAVIVTVQGTTFKRHELGMKATWLIEMPEGDSRLGTVEQLALQHYCEEGFSKGVHCESSLPLTLFYTLLWEEIYNVDIPGAWVTAYQTVPCDLTTESFYETRRSQIHKKFEYVSSLDSDTLSRMMEAKFNDVVKYSHITESNPFNNGSHFKEVVNCLGVKSVIGICRKLVTNYCIWKAGFPDLIVWNSTTMKCKIVEVKGPTDKLSTKQKLWLQYLMDLNIDAEVCLVQGDARYKPKLNNNATQDIPDT